MTREENLHWLNQEIQTWENECQSKHPIKEALYAARKALEQEPCEDAVSRDDVVRIVQHNNPPKALEKIRKLSSVTPQEPNTWSLDDAIATGTTETYFLALWNDIQNAWEEGIGGYRLLENDLGYEVIAWMPLPQPYKAESEGE